MAIRIKTTTDNDIHLPMPWDDKTLCGLDTLGNEDLGIDAAIDTDDKVTCPFCAMILRYSWSVPKSIIAKTNKAGKQ